MPNTKPGPGQDTLPKEEGDDARAQPTQPIDDRPQHEDEYLSKFLQTPTPENKSKDGKDAEPVNKPPESKPGKPGKDSK